MSVKTTLIALMCIFFNIALKGQDYTSISGGVWTDPANWNNTSGWGPSTPPLAGHGSGTITLQHNMSIASGYTLASATLNIMSGSTLSVTGNMNTSGGNTINVYGTLYIVGNLTLNKPLIVHPGGSLNVEGSVIVNSANYLTVGTSAAPPPHANMTIGENLTQQGSGDVTINQNGRLGIFGNVTDSGGGGTLLNVNNGGQVYVHGNINFSGGGSHINNYNSTNPYGLYVNGTVTVNTGAGGTITTNIGDQATMESTNPGFFEWIAGQAGSPLPVTLLFFKAESISQTDVNLVWATASESNFDYFSLERSKDGHSFIELATIKGNGNTTDRKDYFFRDGNPLKGISYYRLKSIDFDGQTETFQVVSVNFNGGKRVIVHPNPVTGGSLNVEFNFLPKTETTLAIYDLNGVELKRKTTLSVYNRWDIDLSPGIYYLKISTDGLEKISKFVVR